MILATGTFLTFTADKRTDPDCFTRGHKIMQEISTYQGPEEKGEDQGWYLNGTKIQVAGFYCQ